MYDQRPLDNDDRCAWVAYELHDGLVQWIVGARMTVENVRAKLPKDSGPAAEPLEQVQVMLESALDEGRRLIEFIEHESGRLDSRQQTSTEEESPVDSASSTLCALLTDFVEMKQQDVSTRSQQLFIDADEGDWPELLPRIAWNVLRILQQAITNASHHAGSCEIHVDVRTGEQSHFFLVEDNGEGFDPEQAPSKRHFGLQAMRHRASIVGGELSIDSEPGRGTRVELRLPTSGSSAPGR